MLVVRSGIPDERWHFPFGIRESTLRVLTKSSSAFVASDVDDASSPILVLGICRGMCEPCRPQLWMAMKTVGRLASSFCRSLAASVKWLWLRDIYKCFVWVGDYKNRKIKTELRHEQL
jgi:hypothetical protein